MSAAALTVSARRRRLPPDERRAQLLAIAIDVFAERGIGAARHAEIAERAGVAVSTVFLYFKTREALVDAVLDAVSRFFLDGLERIHGRERPCAATLREANGLLLDLLETLGLARVDLCGFSFGSRIAMRLALLDPERVRRMVLIGCAHRETVLRRWIVQGWLDALNTGGLEHCFRIVTPSIVGESWLARHEWMHDNMLAAFVRRNHPESMRRLLADTLLEGGDFTQAELGRIPHPVLVLRGAEDIVVPRFLNDELVAWLPDARFDEIGDCAHTVAIEQPDWTADHLSAFLVDT